MFQQNYKNFPDWWFFSFATGVSDTGGQPWAANISANFRKNSKRSKWDTLGLGGNWFIKKTRSKKSRDTVPLIAQSCKNSWDIDFQKFLDCDIFFFIWKIQNFQKFKELCFDFIFSDFVWYFDFLIFWSCENPSRVEKTFIFLIQSILFSNGGLLHGEKKY